MSTLDAAAPRREFYDGLFVSEAEPVIAIRLPDDAAYLGRTAMVLDGKAEVDRYHFLAPGRPERLIILHFERFVAGVPGRINYRPPDPPDDAGPNYRFTRTPVRLGDHDYIHNTWFYDAAEQLRFEPDKELASTARLLLASGHALPDAVQMSRYVRVLGAERRSEIILFYMEPLAATGFGVGDFVAGGPGAAAFDRLSAELTARSAAAFQIVCG